MLTLLFLKIYSKNLINYFQYVYAYYVTHLELLFHLFASVLLYVYIYFQFVGNKYIYTYINVSHIYIKTNRKIKRPIHLHYLIQTFPNNYF